MKLRNKDTGVVVSVSAETAAKLSKSWVPVSVPKPVKAAASKKGSPKKTK